jgi:hypothetical protein
MFTYWRNNHSLMPFRLHGNIESMAVLSDGTDNTRDSIMLAFKDAKIACLEFDDSISGLRTRYAHITLVSHFKQLRNVELFCFSVDGYKNLTFNLLNDKSASVCVCFISVRGGEPYISVRGVEGCAFLCSLYWWLLLGLP